MVEPLELGKRVREIRLSQNLTLEEASKLTGLARSTLSKIENEQISPTFTAVNKLVKVWALIFRSCSASQNRKHPAVVAAAISPAKVKAALILRLPMNMNCWPLS